jgi:hypothetical protein
VIAPYTSSNVRAGYSWAIVSAECPRWNAAMTESSITPQRKLFCNRAAPALDRLTVLHEKARSKPADQRRAILKDCRDLAGCVDDGDGTTFYLRGMRLHTVQVREKTATPLDPGRAAAAFQTRCREAIRSGSNSNRSLVHILAAGDARTVEFHDGAAVCISAGEFRRLQSGRSLEPGHAISRAIGTTTTVA